MRRWSLIAVISLTSLAVAQQGTGRSPFSSDLVLWSHMQRPQQPEQDHPRQAPTPEPSPDTQPAQNPTPSQPAPPAKTPETPKTTSTAQAFVGIINREGESFLLKISESIAYKLDNHPEVQQYEGKRVRVTGTLDTSANLIHVDKVEPLT